MSLVLPLVGPSLKAKETNQSPSLNLSVDVLSPAIPLVQEAGPDARRSTIVRELAQLV